MLINLKNCATDSLENILRGRQNDSKVRGNTLGFMYLFDGLDELDQENADNVLSYITELSKNNNTKKIIISCRSGNLNKIKAKIYFKDISEYKDCADYFVNAQEIKPFERGYHLSVSTPKGEACFDIPLLGRFNVSNALAVMTNSTPG